MEMNMSRIVNYPAPKGACLQHDFQIRIREQEGKEWKNVDCYQVKVDMHEVRTASMAYFYFTGEVELEITCPEIFYIYQVKVRPLNAGVKADYDSKTIRIKLDRPQKLSIEVNEDRFHNLHLFAGEIEEQEPDPFNDNTLYLPGSPDRVSVHRTEELMAEAEKKPKGRTIYFGPGVHYLEECTMRIPSDTNVFLAGGSVLVGTFIVSRSENVKIFGKGCQYLAGFERFSGLNAVRLSHARNVTVKGIHMINPPHYSVYIGGSSDISVEDITSFSCEGWSDGIDIMSSQNISVRDCFLRTSDDCIAIYGRRWAYNGDTSHITVKNCTLWADVAHPTMIGTHGDFEQEGNCLEDIHFEDLDILEHHEYQAEYLGCLAINAGDKNTVRNISYEKIRIEQISHGKILDFQVKCNPDYNPKPGREIKGVSLKDIWYWGSGEVESAICGYSHLSPVTGVTIKNLYIRGKKAEDFSEAGIRVGDFTEDIVIS